MAFKKFGKVAAAAALACLSIGANAALVGSVVSSLGDFNGKTQDGSRATEDFNSPPFEDQYSAFPFDVFAGSAYSPAKLHPRGSSGAISAAPSDNNGRYFDGSNFFDAGGEGFYIQFETGISAFGFDAVDIGDFGQNNGGDDGVGSAGTDPKPVPTSNAPLVVCLSNSASLPSISSAFCAEVFGPSNGAESKFFFGLYDSSGTNTYKYVHFLNNTQGLDGQAFDNLVVALANRTDPPNPAPEPAGLALVGLALLGLAGTRRRQRNESVF